GAQPPLFPLFPGHPQPLLAPQPPHPLAVDPPPLAAEQRPDAAVAEPRMPPHQLQHPPHQLLLGFLPPGLFPLAGARLPQDPAGSALGPPEGLLQVPHRLAALPGTHHFFCTTSWSICLSRASSATSFFSRAFSTSSSLRRLASSAFRPPYCSRQRLKVAS